MTLKQLILSVRNTFIAEVLGKEPTQGWGYIYGRKSGSPWGKGGLSKKIDEIEKIAKAAGYKIVVVDID